MIVVPDEFAAGIVAREGEAGRAWIAGRPDIVADLCRRWNLTVEGSPWHGLPLDQIAATVAAISPPVRSMGDLAIALDPRSLPVLPRG